MISRGTPGEAVSGNHPASALRHSIGTNESNSVRGSKLRAETQRKLRCPVCRGAVEASFLVCPVCTTRLKQACIECAAPLEPIWQVCPYCATPVPPGVVTGEDVLQPVRPRRSRRSG